MSNYRLVAKNRLRWDPEKRIYEVWIDSMKNPIRWRDVDTCKVVGRMLIVQSKLTLIERASMMKKMKNKIKMRRTFYLSGMSGIGKTELLSYAYWETNIDKKIYLDATEDSFSDMVRSLARCQKIQLTKDKKRKTIGELRVEVLRGEEMYIFLDNFHRLNQKQCDYFLKLNRFCKLYLTADDKYLKKEEQKELIQGKENIRVYPIKKEARVDFAKYVLRSVKNREIDPKELAKNSRGIPRRFWNLAKGEELYRGADDRIEDEEINISFIFIAVFSVVTALRYFARGTGERDLYILSAIVIAVSSLFKIFLRELNKK